MDRQNQANSLPEMPPEARVKPQVLTQNREEDRRIVTPYAFGVSDTLVGTPLANNWHRGFALCIDMLFIAMLAELSGILLAGLLAWTFYRAGNKLKEKQRYWLGQKILRFLAAFLLFVLVLGAYEEIRYNYFSTPADTQVSSVQQDLKLDGKEALMFAAIAAKAITNISEVQQQLQQGQCQPALQCWTNYGQGIMDDIVALELSNKQLNSLIDSVIDETELSPEQKAALAENMRNYYRNNYQKQLASEQNKVVAEQGEPESDNKQEETLLVAAPVGDETGNPEADKEGVQSQSSYSLLEWAKGIAGDLGLGFGWAAFYFTVFTAWWNGQTPGKRLFSIKVCKLDGSGLNLWESFGRYGGYGAGLATGLLGFIQIFWDANRQGIQDKISETLVIKVVK